MNIQRLSILIVTAVVAAGAGAWLATWQPAPAAEPTTATVLPQPGTVPEFTLVDQDGAAFTRADLEGRWNLVFFGFTHCPDICPMTLGMLATAQDALAGRDGGPVPRIVFVSVDPGRDSPGTIRDYLGYFDADAVGLTGTESELRALADGLGIFFARADGGTDEYLVDHSAVVLVVGPEGRFRALFSAPHAVENFIADLPLIMAQDEPGQDHAGR